MSHFYSAGAFVVQFRTATDFDLRRVEGRVEHVASGRTALFGSASELVEMLARLWKTARADNPGI
jgi:hypothetical protein